MRTDRENYEPSSRKLDELCGKIFNAVCGRNKTPIEVIEMNIELLRQRLPQLAGYAFYRAQETIANLERQLGAEPAEEPVTRGCWWLKGVE